MSSPERNRMILITGATGNVGRALVNGLLNQENRIRFRGVTRNPRNVFADDHYEVVEGDPSQPDTMASALHDVTTLFINPRAMGEAVADLVDLARRQGVRRVVTLSAVDVGDDPAALAQPSCHNGDRSREAEDAVVGSGLEWVILRASFLAVNTTTMWAGQIRTGDVVRGAFAEWMAAPIHEADIAAVAARTLPTACSASGWC